MMQSLFNPYQKHPGPVLPGQVKVSALRVESNSIHDLAFTAQFLAQG
jgi:hypothetical protein